MREVHKYVVLLMVILFAFVIGVSLGIYMESVEKDAHIEDLEGLNDELVEQLIITNDYLKQINAYHEREFYMNRGEE